MRLIRSALRRHSSAIGIAILLVYFYDMRVHAQACVGSSVTWNVPGTGYDGVDGKRHYRIHVDEGTLSSQYFADAVVDATLASINQWNAKSHLTNVVLEYTTDYGSADLKIGQVDDPFYSGDCAKTWFNLDSEELIIVSELFAWDTADNINDGAAILNHEIGHFLGLDDIPPGSGSSSVMQQVSTPVPDCEGTARQVNGIQDSDASKVLDCLTQYAPPTPGGGGGYVEPDGPYPAPPPEPYYYWCWDYYLATDFYHCVGTNCQYLVHDLSISLHVVRTILTGS